MLKGSLVKQVVVASSAEWLLGSLNATTGIAAVTTLIEGQMPRDQRIEAHKVDGLLREFCRDGQVVVMIVRVANVVWVFRTFKGSDMWVINGHKLPQI